MATDGQPWAKEWPDLPGPVMAQVLRVVDGDTVAVRARIWIRQEVDTNVRLRDIDTPEKHGHCDQERIMAHQAQAAVEALTAQGQVRLLDISQDKYGNRVVARIVTEADMDVGQELLRLGLARPYDGGRKLSWCGQNGG